MGILTGISLFSGAGGLDLAAKWAGIRTVCYVEWDNDCQKNIISRIRENKLHNAPIWNDVSSFDGRPWRGNVDIIFGGFPCQPHSVSGKRRGANDKRNLWPHMLRIVRECRPSFVLGENVPGIFANGYAYEVLAGLEEAGYCSVPSINSSCASGGPFPRKRVFFICHRFGLRRRSIEKETKEAVSYEYVISKRLRETVAPSVPLDLGRYGHFTLPDLGRMGNGMARSMDEAASRLKRCGNGVDPYAAMPAFQKIVEMSGVK